MKTARNAKICTMIVIVLALSVLALPSSREQINIIAGREETVRLVSPVGSFRLDGGALTANGMSEGSVSGTVALKSDQTGSYTLSSYVLGIRVKSVTVNVLPDLRLYPGGELVGLNIFTKGVIAVKLETIQSQSGDVRPADEAGVRIGDVVEQVNGADVYSAEEFTGLLENSAGGDVILTVLRGQERMNISVTPAYRDSKPYIGLWVRNNIAGIGTLTYITEDMRFFAALGHAITDSTSGITVPVENGDLIGAKIINLVIGRKNAPGEIHGMLQYGDKTFGSVYLNNDFGIFGSYNGGLMSSSKKALPIALQSEIHTGPATIFTAVDGQEPRDYSIRIDKVTRQSAASTKSMSITVTDRSLIEKTGGIIQGMSGSPIIQDGKIVGAVTHVLLNDPLRGYGVYVEWMLQNSPY